MFALIKRVSRFETHIDASIERFVFHHRFLGFLLIFVGIPLATLATVCACATMIALPIAFMLGWM